MRGFGIAALGVALLAAACSQQQGEGGGESMDVEESPDISPTAAPGVAFRYFYNFELPDEAISQVQEAHASRCEGLGVQRCRITGLNYTVREDDSVSASLQVKLAPEIAREFGKTAVQDVRQADGRLRSTEFEGEDTAPITTAATNQQSDAQARIAEIERQLAGTDNDNERAQLQAQLNDLRSRTAEARAMIASAQERLASTPMTFHYYGRGGISGFQTNPIADAGRAFVTSAVTMITVVLQVAAWLLPWLLLIALIVLLLRSRAGRAVRSFFASRSGYGEPEA